MKRRRTVVTFFIGLMAVAGVAQAFWTPDSALGGGGAAAAVTVPAGPTPAASVSGRNVTLTWSATTLPGGQPVSGYRVQRYDATTLAPVTTLAGCAGTVATATCTESSVPDGRWRYSVTPLVGVNWQGPESTLGSAVLVDLTAPVNTLSLSSVSGGVALSGATVYYRGSAAGGFRVTNAVTDATAGAARSITSGFSGGSAGWSHTPSAVTTPAGGPYVSNPFTWTAGTTSSPSVTVTGEDVAGNGDADALTFVNDSTAPTTGTISYPNGPTGGGSITVTFTGGSDAGSGIATRRLQRSAAPLTSSGCGTYTTFADIAVDPTSPYADTGRGQGCYRYRLVVRDRVGNQTITSSANVAQVGYAGAVTDTPGLTGQWRLGESGPVTIDTFAGGSGATLQSRTGETGASWTNHGFYGSVNTVLSPAGRLYKTGANTFGSVYYSSGVPASPDYSVSADVVALSNVANDAAGVAGRLAPGADTLYAARYERSTASWALYRVVNLAPTLLATWPQAFTTGTRRVTLAMHGTSIRVLVDGIERIAVTDNGITAAGRGGTVLGFDWNFNNTTVTGTTGLHLDNLQVMPTLLDSDGTNHGAYHRGPTLGVTGALPGDSNTAATFDGVDDYATVEREVSDNFSVELWFKSTAGTGTGNQWWQGMALVDSDATGMANDFGVSLRSDGRVVAGVGNGTTDTSVVSSTGGFDNGAWHHVVMTRVRASGLVTLYVDGAQVGTVTAGTTSLTSSPVLWFGTSGDGTKFLDGSLDEVAVYGQALSAATVADHYDVGATPAPDLAGPTGGSVGATGLVGTGSQYSTSVSLNLVLAAGSDPSGLDSANARLDRYSAPLSGGTCGTYGDAETVATAPTSPRTDLVDDARCYVYEYVVADSLGNATTYSSSEIKVDTTAPTAVSVSGTSGTNSHVVGSTVFYRSNAAGNFSVTASASDAESGIAGYGFPALGAGWTPSGSGATRTYTWTANRTTAGSQTVTGTSNAGMPAPAGSFVLTRDEVAPTGTVTYTGGPTSSPATVAVTTSSSDTLSGVNSVVLQRATGTLSTAGTCGAPGAYTTIATNPVSPYNDSPTARGCYTYRIVVTDEVGNQATVTGANAVQVSNYRSSVAATTGLVNYWRLGEASGTPAADGQGTNTGTYQGGPTLGVTGFISGDTDTAVTFNGSNQYVTANRQVSDNFTVELWFRSSQTGGNGTSWESGAALLDAAGGGNNDFGVSLNAGRVVAGVGVNSIVSAAGLNNGQWHHVVFTRTRASGAMTLQVDGGAAVTGTGNTNALTASTTVNLARSTAANRYFNGTLDEVAVYNTVMPGGTVTAHYNAR